MDPDPRPPAAAAAAAAQVRLLLMAIAAVACINAAEPHLTLAALIRPLARRHLSPAPPPRLRQPQVRIATFRLFGSLANLVYFIIFLC